jgi:hypothetical protein
MHLPNERIRLSTLALASAAIVIVPSAALAATVTVNASYFTNVGYSAVSADGINVVDDPASDPGPTLSTSGSSIVTSASIASPALSASGSGVFGLSYVGSPTAASSLHVSYSGSATATGSLALASSGAVASAIQVGKLEIANPDDENAPFRFNFTVNGSRPVGYLATLGMSGLNDVDGNFNYFNLRDASNAIVFGRTVTGDVSTGSQPLQFHGTLAPGTYSIEYVSDITASRFDSAYRSSTSASLEFTISFATIPEPSVVIGTLLIGASALQRRRAI